MSTDDPPRSATLSRRQWWYRLFLLSADLLTYGMALWGPDITGGSWVVCPFRLVTHTRCPSCGFTRSWYAIASGDWSEAAHLNVLSFLFFALGLLLIPTLIFELISHRDLLEHALHRHRHLIYGLVVVLVIVRYAALYGFEH